MDMLLGCVGIALLGLCVSYSSKPPVVRTCDKLLRQLRRTLAKLDKEGK